MNKNEILKELKRQFDETKKRLGFKSTFEEINNSAYIEDMALSQGFVSNQFSRQMINRMIDGPNNWLGELYSWVYSGQIDVIHLNESKKLSKEEKQEILDMIERIMYLVRKNKRIAFDGLKPEEEGAFIDEIMKFKKEQFKPFMLKYHKKFEKAWRDEFTD